MKKILFLGQLFLFVSLNLYSQSENEKQIMEAFLNTTNINKKVENNSATLKNNTDPSSGDTNFDGTIVVENFCPITRVVRLNNLTDIIDPSNTSNLDTIPNAYTFLSNDLGYDYEVNYKHEQAPIPNRDNAVGGGNQFFEFSFDLKNNSSENKTFYYVIFYQQEKYFHLHSIC